MKGDLLSMLSKAVRRAAARNFSTFVISAQSGQPPQPVLQVRSVQCGAQQEEGLNAQHLTMELFAVHVRLD